MNEPGATDFAEIRALFSNKDGFNYDRTLQLTESKDAFELCE